MAQIIGSSERKGSTGDYWCNIPEMDRESVETGGTQVNIVIEFDDYINWTNYIYKNGEIKRS